VAVSLLHKPFYRMEEICQRWGMTLVDLEAFVFAGELTLSVQVVDLAIEQGLLEPSPDGSLCRLSQGTEYVTGLFDLRAADASRVLRRGKDQVRQFAAKRGEYVYVAPPDRAPPAPDLPIDRADFPNGRQAPRLSSPRGAPPAQPVPRAA
jgi:hypothetical protein